MAQGEGVSGRDDSLDETVGEGLKSAETEPQPVVLALATAVRVNDEGLLDAEYVPGRDCVPALEMEIAGVEEGEKELVAVVQGEGVSGRSDPLGETVAEALREVEPLGEAEPQGEAVREELPLGELEF